MNIHVTVDSAGVAGWENFLSMHSVFNGGIEDIETMSSWLVLNNVKALDFEDTYAHRNAPNDNKYEIDGTEYILTEKQSALFLLRFKK